MGRIYSGSPLVRRLGGPLLTREDIPEIHPDVVDPSSVFNAGAAHFDGKVFLMLRVQTRGRRTFLVMAESEDGFRFEVDDRLVQFNGIESVQERINHIYDPRLTVIDDVCYAMVALDFDDRSELGLARSGDMRSWEFMGVVSTGDHRNGVLFPEKIDGRYLRLDRPNLPGVNAGAGGGREIWLSESDDLLDWRPLSCVIKGRSSYWDELIGSGPPPVKTREGWLHLYHGIATHFAATSIYQVGALLLDLDDPGKVVSRTLNNILEPREPWELMGQVPNVVFPGGMIVTKYDREGFALPDSQVQLYYGAADTCLGLAVTTVQQLLDACRNQ
jgi:beta-1,4-mannooligosaccharide/beta-1,4-mannosyl-N-acetylglucosamine phosphorylase